MPVQNLTKENFFNDLQQRFPEGMKIFCEWIDKYKLENWWDIIFNAGYYDLVADDDYGGRIATIQPNRVLNTTRAPKYHDLPFAMQIGIFMEFVFDTCGQSWHVQDYSNANWRAEITGVIEMLHHASQPGGSIEKESAQSKSTKAFLKDILCGNFTVK